MRSATAPQTSAPGIQDRAIEYAGEVRKSAPKFLGPGDPEGPGDNLAGGTAREDYFRELVRNLDVARLQEID